MPTLARRTSHVLLTLVAWLYAASALAATPSYDLLLDTDGQPASGCTATTTAGTVAGIELVASTVVTTTPAGASVARLEYRRCAGGTLGAPVAYDGGGWPVGFGNGTGGSAVVESSIPRTLLPAAGTMRAVAVATDGSAQDVTGAFAIALAAAGPAVVPVPLSPWLVLPLAFGLLGLAAWWRRRHPDQVAMMAVAVLVAASGLAWAATVIRDGNVGDWTHVLPGITDALGDSADNADLVAVFHQQDASTLYVRFDARIARDNQPPLVGAGANQTITLPATASLAGSATDDGLPNPPGALTLAWSKVSGPGTVAFGNAASATTSATFSAAGTYLLRLTANDGALSASADVTVTVLAAGAGNQAPVVGAGANQTITLPATASLAGSATDDGLPNPPGALTLAWSKVSGPGTVAFGNAASATTNATFSAAGTYVLRLTANDGALNASADVTITVNAGGGANQPPAVSAGPDQAITLPAAATLAGSATDDGLPNPPGALTVAWSVDAGPPAGVSFGDPASPATTATFTLPGTYVLRLTAGDGIASASDTMQVVVADGAPQLLAVPDRTIALGARYQQVLQAVEGNAADALTYALVAAPGGAALSPAPLVDWLPTAAQLGTHAFTARVTDAGGRSSTISFNVTVVKDNRAPRLAPQPDAAIAAGSTFARTLAATDADGDTPAFALVAGPPGMTLAGASLAWTAPATPGVHTVTVRVADTDGASDTRSFTIRVTEARSPLARSDRYVVQLGQTLAIPAPGVLGNDDAAPGRTLAATRTSDPDKGTLSTFDADGSFTYQAPPTTVPAPFGLTEAWRNDAAGQVVNTYPVIGDLNGDGSPDLVLSSQFIGHRAVDGRTGATLWDIDPTGWTDCRFDFPTTSSPLLADVDDDGRLEYVGALAGCERDSRTTSPGYAPADRIFALDATTGRVKWATQISARIGDVLAPGQPPSTEDRFQHVLDGAAYASMAVARFAPAEPPTLMFRRTISRGEGYYQPVSGPARSVGCRGMTGRAADDGQACRVTVLMNGDGTVREMLVAPNPTDIGETTRDPWRQVGPFAADLDGDGVPEIVSGSDVWKRVNGAWTLAWQSEYEPVQALAADLDGDGKAEIVQFHVLQKSGAGSGSAGSPAGSLYQFNGLVVLDGASGAEKRRIRLPFYWTAWLTIADVDADGAADFVINSQGTVMAIGTDGRIKWVQPIPAGQIAMDAGARSGTANVQVYDLDGDGVPEVVTNSHSGVLLLDGRTGAIRHRFASQGLHGGFYTPHDVQIADFDDDGHADILAVNVSGTDRLFYALYRGAPNDWLPGPKAHHQSNYVEGDVADDGRVLHNGAVPTTFRTPRQRGTPVDGRRADATSFTYAAGDGASPAATATVTIALEPQNRPPVITSTPPRALWQRFAPNPPGGLVTNYYDVAAYDPDAGDTLAYSLASSPPWHTIDPATGRIRFEPTCGSYGYPCGWGWTYIAVRVTDSRGAFAEQAFMVNLTTDAVIVPDVLGRHVDDAQAVLQAAGLQGVRHAAIHDARPPGTVLNQIASAGATVAAGDDVMLTLSKGPQPVTVPFLVGQDLASARLALQGLGLGMAITPQASAGIPRNEVMAQSPAAGSELVPGLAPPVALTVSSGAAPSGTIAQIVVEPGNAARLVGDTLPLTATAIFADGTATDVTLNALWTSSAGSVAAVDTTGQVRALATGSTQIRATVGAASGQATLTVAAQAADVTPPTAAIAAPADGASVSGPIAVTGTATDANFHRYALAIAPAGESAWTVIAEGTSPVSGGTLGTLDPATLINDQYTLRLTVFDRGGNESEATTTVQVRGERKVGLFSLAFTDLNVALTGVPITVTRTYDSRDKAKGDFGIGWRLGFNTLRLRTNRVLGTGWLRTQSGIASSLQPRSPHKVSLTLPDGRVEEFDLQLAPTSGVGVLQATRVTGFAPRPGTLGRLEGLDNPDLLVINDGAEDVLVDDGTLDVYDPRRFRYTTLDGTQVELHRSEGVKKIVDRNGNAITIGPDGISHSAGPSVSFTRDAQGRIASIRDLNGHTQAYTYDGNGDLVAHTDAVGGTSRYIYDRHHGLIDMRNPAGTRVTRNDYDASGRLVAMTDADGRQITFTHDDAANAEIVTDRLGRQTRLVYDTNGNVTRTEKAVTIDGTLVSTVETATFDALDNRTAGVDADGVRSTATYQGILPLTRVVDAGGLALTTTLAYATGARVASLTDPAGRTFSFTYSPEGNLSAAAIPGAGNVSFVHDAAGSPVERRDPLGHRTTYARDAGGRVVREETFDAGGALLRRLDFTWDGNGNRTSETLHRTLGGTLTPLTTRYAYDAANRVVAVTDPLGNVTRTEYDAAGRVSAEVDALGRRTAFTHDALGRRTRIDHPDGTFEAFAYDAEGHEIASTDRAGRTTTHAYDELGRRVATTTPDGATTRTVYSPGGRVVATIDARGQRTDYVHDSAGRTVATTLPAVANGPGGPSVRPRIQNAPDALGLPVSVTDANGRVTAFQYDDARRITRTTEPDGTFRTQAWDALGRRIGVTNEEGQATTFTYDALGRLTAVSGLAGDATYAYDEAGNRVRQTDALGRATHYRFDALDRVVERSYPGGETERFAWDAVGNLVAATDGLGRVTTFAYDPMNRLVRKTLPGGASVAYTYHADGQRASVTDMRGTTSYAYDAAGRLRSVTHPTGDVVTYAHDANGNVTSIATPSAVVGYAYDALDRLVQITGPEGTTSLAYDLVGNRLRRTAANGVTTDAVFDARNRPTLLAHLAPGGARLLSYAMTYSPAGRRMAVTEADGSAEAYAYDARGRLVSETRTGSNAYSATHAYDAVGNRIQSVRGGVPVAFGYDANDRLTSDGAASYAWDANGNLATRTQSGVVTTYGFDAEHRLVTVAGAGVSRRFEYDADGQRVRSTAPSGTTRFLVDALNPTGLAQVLEERDGNGALQARYSYGDALIAQSRGAATSVLLQDALGSARALADPAGAITDRYTFDAFGTTVAASGATVNPHRYRGERLDADTGLYHLRARYYDPAHGRFLSRDPLAGPLDDPTALHRYLYARGDPMNFADPTGQAEFSLPSLLTALTIVSLSADVVSFGASIVGAQDIAVAAGTISLIASALTIPVSAGKFALKKVAEESAESFAQKYLKTATVQATREVLENRAKRLATKEAGRGLLKASAELGKQHIDTVVLSAGEAALPELEQVAIGYVRTIVKESGPRLVAPMRDGLLFAFRQLPLTGRERAVANAMVKELDRLLSYAQQGLL